MTGKQAAFIKAYVAAGFQNASEAYRLAYRVKPSTSPATVHNSASKLLDNPTVAARVAAAREKMEADVAKVAARYVVTKDRISHALALMAFADPRDFYRWTDGGDMSLNPSDELTDAQAGAVQSVSSAVTKYGRSLKVELADRRGALMDLAKLHGHVVDRKDVRVIKSLEDLSEAELMALAGLGPEPTADDGATKH